MLATLTQPATMNAASLPYRMDLGEDQTHCDTVSRQRQNTVDQHV